MSNNWLKELIKLIKEDPGKRFCVSFGRGVGKNMYVKQLIEQLNQEGEIDYD